jgi:DNA-directed RNA polymerase specialized sigma24 family protein
MARHYAGNQYDAEDLVQETFFIAFKKFDQLRDENKLKSCCNTRCRMPGQPK